MKQTFSKAQLQKLIRTMQRKKILVLGDLMLDEYLFGKVNRISPEAPVPVVLFTKEVVYPGGAANVARNLADFGIECQVSGLMGEDIRGKQLTALLKEKKIGTQGAVVERNFMTIRKTRVIARQQQLVRVDREEPPSAFSGKAWLKLQKFLTQTIPQMDAVIIQDYGKGFITQALVTLIASLCNEHQKILTVDPNINNPLNWSGATAIKPNRQEALAAAAQPFPSRGELMREIVHYVGEELLRKWGVPYVLMTLSEEGMLLFDQFAKPYSIPAKVREVYDVSGAGDTAIAFFTTAMTAGLHPREAAEIANHAAGVVVGKLGTATVSPKELIDSFTYHNGR